jgi:ATP-dependent protease ClpP protease subunit
MPKRRSSNDDYNDDSNTLVYIVNNPSVQNIYSIYLNKEVGESEHYRKMFNLLRTANNDDRFIIYLNNFGGYVHTGIDIINSMNACKGQIVTVVSGPLYSMAPLIALSADQLVIEPNTFFMFHDYSGGTSGKGHEQHASITHEKPFFDEMFTNITKKFLSTREIRSVNKGRDLYLTRDDIMKRLRKLKRLVE